ncbi:MAG: T9SS type A sorting domain-containing protein [Chitinophagales bacterium]
MKNIFPISIAILLIAGASWQLLFLHVQKKTVVPIEAEEAENGDYFFLQHSFPYGKIDYAAHRAASTSFKNAQSNLLALKPDGISQWEFAGPVNIGGRIVDIEFDPTNQQVAYLGAASGGVFKTTDGGNSWLPVFDDETTLSIGDIAVAPSNTAIVYVGTGEANGGSGSLTYDANGVYKSTDAGVSWTNVGLQSTHMTGRMAVHPTNPDIVFAATMGDLYGPTPDRGLYKTTDGGATWNNVLFVNDSTGVIDVVINPQDPDIVFAATWMRTRHPNSKDYAGVESGVWKSEDGGNTFLRLGASNGLPPLNVEYSRIGIDLCGASPNVVYCVYLNDEYSFAGLFKSVDNGNSWVETNDQLLQNSMGNGQGYWYGRVKCDPVNPNILFLIGFDMYKTINGGNSYSTTFSGVHVDQHTVAIHPLNDNFVMLGNDGGLHVSNSAGSNWTFNATLPISQIYRAEIDPTNPSNIYAGLQDNGTVRTLSGLLNDYQPIFGGDGFQSLVNPNDSYTMLVGYQHGNIWKSSDGGFNFNPSYTNGIFGTANWNYPLTIDPLDAEVVYTGTQNVFRSADFGDSWTAISPELTTLDNTGTLIFGTISFIDPSPLDQNIIYAGTDDGKVWNTLNGGISWNEVDNGLPERWVTCVKTDPFDEHTAYVTLSGYRFHDNANHVYKTIDDGETWTDIGSNLPDVPVNCILADASLQHTLYLATDVGVYYTINDGGSWEPAGTGMPVVTCVDLKLHEPTRTLVVGTYGRSVYKLNLDDLVAIPAVSNRAAEFDVFPNPLSANVANINYTIEVAASVTFSLQDLNGKVFSRKNVKGIAGKNSFAFDVKNFPAGVYLIEMKAGENSFVQKMIIQ